MSQRVPDMQAISINNNSKLGVDLEKEIEHIREQSEVKLNGNSLGKIVKKHTNITAAFNLGYGVNASTSIPEMDKNNVLLSRARRAMLKNNDSKSLLTRKDLIEGVVDLKNVKVTGDFTSPTMSITIGKDYLISSSSRFTVRETVAIVLHEIGHIFSYFELLGRVITTNYCLEEASKQLLEVKSEDLKYKIISDMERITGDKFTDKSVIAAAKNKTELTVLVLNESILSSISSMGVNLYDMRGFEQLADQFSSRLGYGRDLVTALDKLNRLFHPSDYWSTPIYFIVFILTAYHSLTFLLFYILSNHFKQGMYTYDTPQTRLNVLESEQRRVLDRGKLTLDEKKEVLRTLTLIKKLKSQVKDRKFLGGNILKVLVPSGRVAHRSREVQKNLETLSSSKFKDNLLKIEIMLEENNDDVK